MAEFVFFYGTLMTPFNRSGRQRIDPHLSYIGRGSIAAALFDLGIYPAAVPTSGSRVIGELYEVAHPEIVLPVLDEIEGYRATHPEASLYTRARTTVTLDTSATASAWAYFYNAPLGQAQRIASGDYLEHLKLTPPVDPF